MFNNSKYGNILTIILIVAVIAIIGIVGFIGYRIYGAYYVDTGATQAAIQFEQTLQNNNMNNGQYINNTIGSNKKENITGVDDSAIGNNNDNSNNNSSQSTTTYKGFAVVGTIQIPDIKLKYPILEKLSTKSLKTSVVLMYTAQGLNNIGNSVIIGHNYRNGTMFSDVDKLTNGDYIYITDITGRKVKYEIYKMYRGSGSESDYITRNTEGKREISLSTCTDDSKARLIVLAREV